MACDMVAYAFRSVVRCEESRGTGHCRCDQDLTKKAEKVGRGQRGVCDTENMAWA